MKQSEFLEIIAILSVIGKSYPLNEVRTEEKIQIHFMFGLPMSDLAEDLVLFLLNLTDLRSDSLCTILQGQCKNIQLYSQASKYDLTIGDDIELVTRDLSQSNNIVTNRSSSTSIIQNYDETHIEVQCIRKCDTLHQVYNKFKKPWRLHIFLLIICFTSFWLFDDDDDDSDFLTISEILVIIFVLQFIWLGYHYFSFILLRLYFSLSIFNINPSDDLVSKKQIYKELLKLTGLLVSSLWYISILISFYTDEFDIEDLGILAVQLSMVPILFCILTVSLPLFLKLLTIFTL